MRTLVTGATGHVGANVVRRLAVSGRRIRILARPTSPLDIVSRYVSDVAMGDLLDRSSLVAAMRGCDVVYHAAAVYSLWRPDASDIFRPTVEGSRNVLEAAAEAGVRRVVYVSSIVTLAARANGRLDESGAPAKPRTPYLRAKVEAEQHAREFAESASVEVVFVLPTLVLGPNALRPTPSVEFVVNYLRRGAPAYFDMGMNIVDVEDVAKGILLAEERGKAGERYILSGEDMSFREFYARLHRLTGLGMPIAKLPNPIMPAIAAVVEGASSLLGRAPFVTRDMVHDFAGRNAYASCAKAQQELGYSYLDADEVLRRAVEWALHMGWVPERRRARMRLQPDREDS